MICRNRASLLAVYDKYMHLKIFVSESSASLITKQMYVDAANAHNAKIISDAYPDAGFDLFAEPLPISCRQDGLCTFDFRVKCSAEMVSANGNIAYNTGYFMFPRSSLSNTPLRLANSVGIIDAGYRGYLIGKFDGGNEITPRGLGSGSVNRLVQICAPGLVPVYVDIVDRLTDLGAQTTRGTGGFGSTGE